MGKGQDMSEAAAKVAMVGAAKALHVRIVGKVTRVRRHEKFFYTTIICPAVDEYSRPSVVEVRSKARFADVDEVTRCEAVLGGYEGKSYAVVDKETGERKTLVPVNLFLDAVED